LCRNSHDEGCGFLFSIRRKKAKTNKAVYNKNMYDELTFDRLPEAVSYLIGRIESLEQALQKQNERPDAPVDGWMNIDELKEYLPDKPAKPTIYGWVSQRLIPHHKGGKKLRFRKSEIDNWLSEGKRQSAGEIEAAAQEYLTGKGGRA
jgi:excisionase family DNA binding protein